MGKLLSYGTGLDRGQGRPRWESLWPLVLLLTLRHNLTSEDFSFPSLQSRMRKLLPFSRAEIRVNVSVFKGSLKTGMEKAGRSFVIFSCSVTFHLCDELGRAFLTCLNGYEIKISKLSLRECQLF